MRTFLLGPLAVVIAAQIGCSGSDSAGASCGAFTPCGGELVATWNIQQLCSPQRAPADCPGYKLDLSRVMANGTVTFAADKSYNTMVTTTGTADITVPKTCLTLMGMTLTCQQLNALLALAAADPDSDIKSAMCSEAGADCACSVTSKGNPQTERGTYRTSGSTVFIKANGSMNETPNDYCVSGNTLKTAEQMGGMMSMLSDAAAGTLVLVKQ